MQHRGTPVAVPITTAKIIGLALAAGTALFAVVPLFVDVTDGKPLVDSSLMLTDLLVMAGVAVPLSLVLPMLASRRIALRGDAARQEVAEGKMPPELLAGWLAGCAVIEGVGLFGAVVFLITRDSLAVIAPAIAVGMIVARLPTREGVQRIVENALVRGPH